MALTRYKLGDLIQPIDVRNISGLGVEYVRGISTGKEFIDTKANLDGVSLTSYKIVKHNDFAYVSDTSRRGDKIAIAYNNNNQDLLISSIYTVFNVKQEKMLLPYYLFIFFNRPEFDRYSRFNSWGSARETFSWEDLCDIDIELPTIDIQQKYVDIYNAMLANQKSYERGLDDLKLVCDAYIENLRREIPCEAIGPYLSRHDDRNTANQIKNVKGVSTSKEFRDPTSKVNRNELANYKIVKPRQISFVQTTHNEKVFAYAFNNTNDDIVVTSVNEVFSVNEDIILPEYLSMFFNRREFDRYARYHSWGSARETFTWDDLKKVRIPIANPSIQKSIANIYKVYKERKAINEQLKSQIKDICPILIKGSIEEGKKTMEK